MAMTGVVARGRGKVTDEQTTCTALRLALVATRLRVAWHAGAISAETAMESLDQAFCQLLLSPCREVPE